MTRPPALVGNKWCRRTAGTARGDRSTRACHTGTASGGGLLRMFATARRQRAPEGRPDRLPTASLPKHAPTHLHRLLHESLQRVAPAVVLAAALGGYPAAARGGYSQRLRLRLGLRLRRLRRCLLGYKLRRLDCQAGQKLFCVFLLALAGHAARAAAPIVHGRVGAGRRPSGSARQVVAPAVGGRHCLCAARGAMVQQPGRHALRGRGAGRGGQQRKLGNRVRRQHGSELVQAADAAALARAAAGAAGAFKEFLQEREGPGRAGRHESKDGWLVGVGVGGLGPPELSSRLSMRRRQRLCRMPGRLFAAVHIAELTGSALTRPREQGALRQGRGALDRAASCGGECKPNHRCAVSVGVCRGDPAHRVVHGPAMGLLLAPGHAAAPGEPAECR